MGTSLRAYEYWLAVYRRVWRGTIFSSFLNPVLYLSALGVGLGKLVNQGVHPLGIPYTDFVAPGMLAAIGMQVASIEASFPVRGAIRWNRQYHAMLATPLRVAISCRGTSCTLRRASPSPARSTSPCSPPSGRFTRHSAYSRGPQSC